jgi:TolB protein
MMPAEQQPPTGDDSYVDDDLHQDTEYNERRYPRSTIFIACFLLLVFLCGMALPAAGVLMWWFSGQADDRPSGPWLGPWDELFHWGVQPSVDGGGQVVNRIAFINLDGQLETIYPDGSGARQLTHSDQPFFFPAWSPDGSRLAVLAGDSEGGSVYTVSDSAATSNLEEIYHSRNQAPFYVYWAPDSSQVTFLATAEGGLGLFLAQANQPGTVRRLALGQPFYWDWSPGGEQLLIHSGLAGQGSRLAFIDLHGHSDGREVARSGFFQAPGISPSGRYWAYAEIDRLTSRRLVVENGREEQRLSLPHLGQVALSWSPTEDRLAFTSPLVSAPAFYGPLRLIEIETGENRLLTPDIVVAFFWSPDGRRIAFLTLAGERLDKAVRAYYGGESATPAPGHLRAAGLQNGGMLLFDLWVVEVDAGEAYRLVTFQPAHLFVTQFLPFFDQYSLSHQIWSPASDALVLPMADAYGIPRIHVVQVDGRYSNPIAAGGMAFWSRQ